MSSANSETVEPDLIVTVQSSLSFDYDIKLMVIIPNIGVVFPFLALLLDRYHFDFWMNLKKTLTFSLLSNPVFSIFLGVQFTLGPCVNDPHLETLKWSKHNLLSCTVVY